VIDWKEKAEKVSRDCYHWADEGVCYDCVAQALREAYEQGREDFKKELLDGYLKIKEKRSPNASPAPDRTPPPQPPGSASPSS
jgi:hypothetical protein